MIQAPLLNHCPLKIILLRCYVFSDLLDGMEAWTLLKKNISDRLEAFEMWTLIQK